MSARLSPEEKRDREVTEAGLQLTIVETAAWLGWQSAHWRALQNRRGIWQVPVEGGLGKGWPDLTLVHQLRRRIIFAELKRQNKPLEPDQERVLGILRELVGPREVGGIIVPTVEVYVWRPSDIRDPIEESAVYAILSARP